MNRKDREITDQQEIIDVLHRCNTLRLGMFMDDYPYVVPVSFGVDEVDGKVIIYFHGAIRGQKIDCLKKNNHVCIEADVFYKVEPTRIGITARYESIIGFGTIEETDEEEKLHGLRKMVEHYQFSEYPIDRCRGLSNTVVYRIVVTELTGKRNLPGSD
ncbi:pyridoxamine 5'-phosphate oxidase family protein [Clostridium sp. P21]|uniref:Pyridoxamine 5'-phosphate oxidase family protein n=1 Tax=Clostridium muellerianum TaxID=2716538 RepID=A0A7Y0EHM3_9CLOT|nr:pyridoxamine 5'-phosphate oxidase family protein [Clostridium muellerianum]NMM63626.1 pyridoxamine 5'-phosphate oxidase family protein [Clostridium muellerianum]